jgi:hypothetical protein
MKSADWEDLEGELGKETCINEVATKEVWWREARRKKL